jgi:ATP-dependent DNA ligase
MTVAANSSPAMVTHYVEHIEHYGTALFERVCEMDLEGIVAKHSFGNYVTERERTTWFKIKEPERLTDRKHELRRLLSKVPASRMRYVEHVEHYGTALFERVCKMDLEGIVAKHSFGNYITERERTTWFKIKNRSYSQSVGREKLFERERHREPVPGWHSCALACAEAEHV